MKPRKKFCHDDLNDSVSNDDDFDDDLDDHDDKHAFFLRCGFPILFPTSTTIIIIIWRLFNTSTIK